MEEQYINCPEAFRDNCLFNEISCYKCSAFGGDSNQLQYSPVIKEPSLAYREHPQFKQAKQSKKDTADAARKKKRASTSFKNSQNNVRQGHKVEKQVLQKIGAKSTVGSGAVFGDGDGYITLANGEKLYIEHKARLANRNVLGPTSAEWAKARVQGAALLIITSEEAGSIVTMSLDTFKELIALNSI